MRLRDVDAGWRANEEDLVLAEVDRVGRDSFRGREEHVTENDVGGNSEQDEIS